MHLLLLAVHPHIRGAYRHVVVAHPFRVGSSPHTWGIRYIIHHDKEHLRFIPTYVGHTRSRPVSWTILSVHPHIRGAYDAEKRFSADVNGSSPHTWGIRYFLCPFQGRDGSSPHTWGIPSEIRGPCFRHRFIPTYVGHTASNLGGDSMATVHPHIRGAYGDTRLWVDELMRFIPTYVGHTRSAYVRRPVFPVHPHIRGAYRSSFPCSKSKSGSSPHTWGIRAGLASSCPRSRFIPTYVGHTHTRPCFAGARSVHPHIRGAYIVILL